MIHLADVRIRPKLILFFILTGILPLFFVGVLGVRLATKAVMEQSFQKLITVQDLRKTQVEQAFLQHMHNLAALAQSDRIHDLVGDLNRYQERQGRGMDLAFRIHSESYRMITEKYKTPLHSLVSLYGYQDLLLVSPGEGHVMFALTGTDDLGTNLGYGRYKNTGLAHAWRTAMETGETSVIDFAPFAAHDNRQTAFIAHPVLDREREIEAVLVLQLSPDFITEIMDSRQGMGETGESYLLGWSADTNRFSLRSNVTTLGDGRYVVGYRHPTVLPYWKDAIEKGAEGGIDRYEDSAGREVLAAYNRLHLAGLEWYLISKIDAREVKAPMQSIIFKMLGAGGFLVLLTAACAWAIARKITRPILEDVAFAEEIAAGKFKGRLALRQQDELGKLARALNHMAVSLEEMDWLKRGKEGLDDVLRGEHDLERMERRFLSFFVRHLEGVLGAFYLHKEGVLELTASYAFTDRSGNFNRISLGEGLVGQAALEREIMVFSHVQEAAPLMNYGAGETPPSHYLVAPLVFEEQLVGVCLVGAMDGFSEVKLRFVGQNTENVAILFDVARSRKRIESLLDQAQEQQEELQAMNEELAEQTHALRTSEAELQAQQEELRVINEELEEQTRALKESEGELQAQQEELRVTNEELEERTSALEEQKHMMRKKNTELVKSQEEVKKKVEDLEVASRYKSEFLANMSHELRTPLNSILILSQLFAGNREGNLTEKQIESANAIHSSGSDLLRLINEILDLSKVEAGKIDLFFGDMTISDLIRDLERLFTNVAEEKGVGFVIELAETAPPVIHTDAHRLQQVIRNLLTNAFKFTERGNVTLFVGRPAAALLPEGMKMEEGIAIGVKDDGIGIPEEKQAAIYEAFQQADGSTSRKYGGTGLGLSISKELMRLLGGQIHLTSREGEGSTFTVVMPVNGKYGDAGKGDVQREAAVDPVVEKRAEPLAAPVPVAAEKKQGEEVADDRKSITPKDRTLLIIEDDRRFARVMRDFGRERSYKCLIAEDGETGLHFADYYRPSAIILDIGLPGIDGWTVMERLKENPEIRHIPVHFMSAGDRSLDALRMGAVGFLSKPVSMEKVEAAFSKIEEILNEPVRNLLVVEDEPIQRESIRELIGNEDVAITTVGTGKEAFTELTRIRYDCMILDLSLGDMSGFDLLEKIRHSESCCSVPVIIYTGRELTAEEEKGLRQYTESIIIKGVKSPERLLDESALFLHRVEANLPADKQRMLRLVHDKEAILSGKTVLLVDDDMRNVFALSSVLEEKGIQVVIARNGLESLQKLEQETVDLVLMDIMMPEMDGYTAMQEIRKQPRFRKLPIIALTAKAMKGDRARCIEAGASDYLAKPVNTEKLLSMLRVWLYA